MLYSMYSPKGGNKEYLSIYFIRAFQPDELYQFLDITISLEHIHSLVRSSFVFSKFVLFDHCSFFYPERERERERASERASGESLLK